MKFEPRYAEENFNVPQQHELRDFFRLSLYLLGIVFGLYIVLGFAAEKIAERLPPRFEAAIAAHFTGKLDDSAFTRSRDYLQQTLDRLVKAADLPDFQYKVTVQEQDEINAIALPAGRIVVFSGLLDKLRSENELGHYAHRDHLRGLGRGLVLLSITATLGLSDGLPSFIAPSVQTFSLKYSREQEAAADLFALNLVVRSYGHAGGALDLFAMFDEQERQTPALFSTHPDSRWRRQHLASRISQEGWPQKTVQSLPAKLPFAEEGSP
ncbi:MAG: M48 family metallopeptidase [Candidatus Electronema sp. VV]